MEVVMKHFFSFMIPVLGLSAANLFAGCPNPEELCPLYHPGSTATAYCAYAECFDMSYGEAARVVATDDEGLFPSRWNMWHSYEPDIPLWGYPCEFETKGSKSKIWIPEEPPICYLQLESSDAIYYEHFASNPDSGCLGWMECKLPKE